MRRRTTPLSLLPRHHDVDACRSVFDRFSLTIHETSMRRECRVAGVTVRIIMTSLARTRWLIAGLLGMLSLLPPSSPAGMSEREVRNVLDCVEKAGKGDAAAQFNLGLCYAKGEGVEKDDSRAVTWYRKSAEQGYAEAQLNLARCYDGGEGVPKDETEAYAYFSLAASTLEQARRNCAILEGRLSKEQLTAARERATALRKEINARIAKQVGTE